MTSVLALALHAQVQEIPRHYSSVKFTLTVCVHDERYILYIEYIHIFFILMCIVMVSSLNQSQSPYSVQHLIDRLNSHS